METKEDFIRKHYGSNVVILGNKVKVYFGDTVYESNKRRRTFHTYVEYKSRNKNTFLRKSQVGHCSDIYVKIKKALHAHKLGEYNDCTIYLHG